MTDEQVEALRAVLGEAGIELRADRPRRRRRARVGAAAGAAPQTRGQAFRFGALARRRFCRRARRYRRAPQTRRDQRPASRCKRCGRGGRRPPRRCKSRRRRRRHALPRRHAARRASLASRWATSSSSATSILAPNSSQPAISSSSDACSVSRTPARKAIMKHTSTRCTCTPRNCALQPASPPTRSVRATRRNRKWRLCVTGASRSHHFPRAAEVAG